MLHEKLTTGAEFLGGTDFYKNNLPDNISSNLHDNIELRPYQLEAFGRFKYYMEDYSGRPKNAPLQMLFHMATGSGKTVIMSGLMLYLYEQGYRNFLFFVNSTNIINKTIDNFLNSTASKFLFAESVYIKNKQIKIKQVDNFQAANSDDINIVFSTIQGLHTRLNTPRENSLTYDDFETDRIVLISDEAHHINAETKKASQLNQEEMFDLSSWEGTVRKIFTSNPENILLEFTATIDLNNEFILDKYRDSIIFDYPLKEFRIDGYSKEVKVLQSDTKGIDRAMQAILLSQFRRKIFEKNGWLIKPVVLFKSKTISESNDFLEEFLLKIKTLNGADLEEIKHASSLEPIVQDVFIYLEKNNISLDNFALELQSDFSEDKCISVNSKDDSVNKQIAINSLEDHDNEYRAIFAVDKLNEGWDVLNLFDIVRMYDTRDGQSGKPGKTTLSEAQLIGRGARYCPFRLNDEQPLYQRKYDTLNDDIEHDIKLCEELYYHSAYNPRYIQELHTALQEIGIQAKKSRTLQLKIKPNFKEISFFKTGFIFKNERVKYLREDVVGLNSSFIGTTHKARLLSGYSQSSTAFEIKDKKQKNKSQKDYFIKSFGSHVIKKALAKFPEFRFSNLKILFPHLKSISDFIGSDSYLGLVKVEVDGDEEQVKNLSQENKLSIVINVFEKLVSQLQLENIGHRGTAEFKPFMVKDIFTDKTLNIVNEGDSEQEFGIGQGETSNPSLYLDLSNKDWFVFNENFGTSEEKYLVKYIDKVATQLKKHYSEIYLARNEKHFQLFNFDDGQAFEPDFVLFLIKKDEKTSLHYQVFIEPKGAHLMKQDEWKHNFLMKLKSESKIEQLWKDREYIVWGMPFYNEDVSKNEFNNEMQGLM